MHKSERKNASNFGKIIEYQNLMNGVKGERMDKIEIRGFDLCKDLKHPLG